MSGVEIVIALLGSNALSTFITYLFTRRKLSAETRSEEVDTNRKISDLLQEMRTENADLIKQNIQLEKHTTDLARQLETLRARLEARDKELQAATKQLDLLRELAKDAPITETLKNQLATVNQVVINLQKALETGQEVMLQKEEVMKELLRTNRDLTLQKPGKTIT